MVLLAREAPGIGVAAARGAVVGPFVLGLLPLTGAEARRGAATDMGAVGAVLEGDGTEAGAACARCGAKRCVGSVAAEPRLAPASTGSPSPSAPL